MSSIKFALILLVVIAVACILGTLLPQESAAVKLVEKRPDLEQLFKVLKVLGFTHIFSSPWFLLLLATLAVSLYVCTWRRIKGLSRLTGRARGRAIGSCMTHVSLILVLLGGVVRGAIGLKGDLSFREGETRQQFRTRRGMQDLPFQVRLADFEVEYHEGEAGGITVDQERLLVFGDDQKRMATLPIDFENESRVAEAGVTNGIEASLLIRMKRRVEDFVIDIQTREVGTRSTEYRNPALQVETVYQGTTNSSWLFAFHPDFNMHATDGTNRHPFILRYDVHARRRMPGRIKDYKSHLELIEDGNVVREKVIEVNAPLSYRGFTFYQSGYDPKDASWTSLQVVNDPGVPLVYAGFALMIIGLIIQFYIYPAPMGKRGKS